MTKQDRKDLKTAAVALRVIELLMWDVLKDEYVIEAKPLANQARAIAERALIGIGAR